MLWKLAHFQLCNDIYNFVSRCSTQTFPIAKGNNNATFSIKRKLCFAKLSGTQTWRFKDNLETKFFEHPICEFICMSVNTDVNSKYVSVYISTYVYKQVDTCQ